MKVGLQNVGFHYNYNWLVRKLDLSLPCSSRTGIGGPNGSGKTSLLKLLYAAKLPDEGSLRWTTALEVPIEPDKVYQHAMLAAPNLMLPETLTLREILELHSNSNKLKYSLAETIDLLQLNKHQNKQLRYYSSGMMQRVKLGLCLYYEYDLLLFDEPTSYLDVQGKEWFYKKLHDETSRSTVVIASNEAEDLAQVESVYLLG